MLLPQLNENQKENKEKTTSQTKILIASDSANGQTLCVLQSSICMLCCMLLSIPVVETYTKLDGINIVLLGY